MKSMSPFRSPHYLRLCLAFIAIVFFSTKSIQAQTTLAAGELMFTGYNADAPGTASTDGGEFSFVLLRDLDQNTVIYFTDFGWNTTSFYTAGVTNDGVIKWTVSESGGLSCGTEVKIVSQGVALNASLTTSHGTVADADDPSVSSLNGITFNSSGDQIIAYQGTFASPTFISALQAENGAFGSPGNDRGSNVPSGLTEGTNAMSPTEIDNLQYNSTVTNNTAENIRNAIATDANWTGSATPLTIGNITFTASACFGPAADTSPPVVSGITVSGSPAAADASMSFVVDFDENANNVSTDDFTVSTASGTAAGTVSSVSAAAGDPITVTVGSITGTGSIRLDLKASTNITDDTGNGNGTNGNVASFTSGATHTVDRDAPSAPSTPDMTTATDSGNEDHTSGSTSDNLTNDQTPTFEGTAEAGSTVNLISNVDGNIGSATATGGNYSITASTLTAGAHTITATATDAATNTSGSSSGLAINIDVTQPTVSVSTTSTDPTNDNPIPVTITFNSEAENMKETDITVVNGTTGDFASADSTTFTVNVTPSGNGNVQVSVGVGRAFDQAGNGNTVSNTLSLTYDGTSPTLNGAGSTPTDNATGVSISDNIVIDFSENIVKGTGNVTLKVSGGADVETFDINTATATTTPTAGNVGVSGDKVYINPTSDLTGETTYAIRIASTAIDDGAGNDFAGISNDTDFNFTTADVTAPTLTNQALAQTASNALQITYQSNETGTLYYVVTTNSSTPSTAQIKAGNDQSGTSTNVVSSGNAAVTVTGSDQTVALNGLTLASTTYHLFIYEEDAAINASSVVTNSAAVDATAPTLINQALAQTASNALQITYQSNEMGTLYYVVTTNSSTPSQAQILAGNDQSGTSTNVVSSGNAAVTVTGSDQTIALNGLTLASTTYHVFIYEADAIGNESSVVTNSAAVDATAPTLTNQALAQTASNALQITYQSNETGTLYYVVTTNSSTPSQAQILAGNDQSGTSTNVVSSGNAAVTVTGSNQTIALNGLTLASTTYHLFIYEADAAGNESSVVTNSAAVDATAPTFEGANSDPIDGATTVAANASIIIDFSENIQKGTGNITIRNVTGSTNHEQFDISTATTTTTPTDGNVGISGDKVYLNPTSDMTESNDFSIRVDASAIDDLAGNSFAGITNDTDYNFTVADATAPTLQSSSPADGATNVTLSQNLTLTFDDNIVVGTGNITIVETGVGTFEALDVTNGSLVSVSTTTVTLNPTGTLKKGTAYHITIDATALDDDAANDFAGISNTTDLNFTTVNVVINEVVTDPQQDWSTNGFNGTVGPGSVTQGTDEWVELFIQSAGIDFTGWTIELNDGTDVTGDLTTTGAFDSQNYVTTGSGTFNNTESGDYLVLGNVDGSGAMNNTGLTINLKDPGGAIVDAVVIGGGGGEAPTGNALSVSDESVQRIPNGTDTDTDDSDFVQAGASIGAANDNTAPTVTGVSSSTANGTSKVGDVVAITVTFSETVNVTGTPQITLETGTTDRTVNYTSGSGSTTLTYNYTVQAGDVSADLDYVATNSLVLNSGTINDGANNAATLTLATPGAANSLGANKDLVIDGVVPTLSPVAIASSQTASEDFVDASHATTGNLITLSFTASEALNANPTVGMSIGGTGVTPTVNNLGSNNYSATYTVLGTENEGAVTFTIDFTDAAGNAGTQVTAVTNSSSIEADFNAPTLSSVTLSTNNSTDNQHGTTGDVITLGFTSSDVLSANPTVGMSIGGTGVTATVNDLGSNNYSATYTLLGTENEGAVTFTIDFVDDAGISGTQVTATTNASSVEADFNAPTLSTVSIASSQTAAETFVNASHASDGNTVRIDITSSDVLSALPTVGIQSGGVNVQGPVTVAHDNPGAPDFQNFNVTYTVDGSGTTPGTDKDADGTITFTIDFTDDVGIAGTQVTATTDATSVEVDNTAPTLTSVTLASSQTAAENFADASHATTGNLITLSFTADDDLSANPTVGMSIGGTGVTPTVNTGSAPNYTATYTLLGTENEGAVTFTIDFTDDAGNAGTQVTATTNASSIEADFNAPTLSSVTLSTNNSTDNQHGTTGNVVTLAFTSSDVLSANPTVGMSIGGTGVTATVNDLGSNNYSATYTLLGTENEGAVTFTIDFIDDAGISGTQVTATTDASSIEADFNAPTLSTVTLITDNGTNNQRANGGNTVLLDLVSSDVLSALPTVAIKSGGTDVQGPLTVAHDNPGAPDFQNFNVTFTVDGTGSTPGTDRDADGSLTFTVDFVDDAGISGTQVTATTNTSSVTVDTSAPTVTDVSSSTADGSFIPGNVIAVTVTFNESVTVTGTPQLTLETGTTDRIVNYSSGSPGTTLTFNYTVQAGDVSADLDYVANNSLALNSGTIIDGAGNAATLTLPDPAATNSLGANKALVIDTSNPTVSSTSPLDNATDVGITGDITITFNEDIAFGTGNITLVDITGAGTNTIVIDAASPGSQASISGAVLTINPTANLELNNNYSVQIAATAIDDTAGNSFAGITDNTTLNFTTINTSVAFSSTTSSAAESTSSADLEVTLNAISGATVTVDYTVVGTATGGGTDYTLASGTLTINAGSLTNNITIASIIDDALDEDNETVIVTLSNPTNAGLGTNTQHTYTINDDDATPTVAFNTTASNGAESVSSADLQVDLSAVSGRNVTVNYAITGTATGSGTDYTLANGALVINAGDANNNITIASIIEDALDEAEETVIVTLSSPVNATLGTNTVHTYTINDNDATPTVAFSSTSSSAAETATSANLQVALSAVSGQDVMVNYTVAGTASGSGTDYTLANGTLTFTAGSSSENITIASIIGDALDEDDETVIVTLSSPTNATLGTNTQHTYTILDDDATPTIAFSSTTSSGAESVSSANLQVALSAVSGRDVNVSYTVSGTATGSGTDYTLANGTLTITASNSSNNITIASIIEDALDEFDETVIVTLSSPTNATLGTNTQHTYTITDNDAEPTVAFALATDGQTEDQPSQDIQVSLSAVSGKTVTVNYAVTGTATAGGTDHTTVGGTITFNPGDQDFQQQIVGIVDDLLDEENETIILTLSSPSNATLGAQTTHTYTITDNDGAPTVSLSVDNNSIDEASGTATLTATLSAVSGKNVDVTIGYTGTAINGTDYNSNASTTITINAGSPSATAPVIITPVNDGDPEANETIIAEVTNVNNGTENGVQSQTITIVDDDTPDLTFTTASSNGAESVSSAGITVDLSLASGLTVTADYALTGTATEGTDYTLAAGTLTFNPGDVQKTITIASIIDDAILEGNETVIITLTNLSNANAGTNQVHTYTINNNDAAAVTIADVSQAENGGDITVTATLDNAVEGGFTVDVSTADGTATTADTDYTAVTSQTLTFAGTAAETQTFTITPTADTKLEANETLTVSQGNLANTSLSIDISDGATITINNDDNAAVTIEDVSGAENGGAITVTATLDNAVQGGFQVDVNSTDNTATTGDSDYTAVVSQTLTFAGTAGETQTFTVMPTADTKVEADESLFLGIGNLQATSHTVAVNDGALVTITNDDAATLAINDVSRAENADGGATTTYTFTTTFTGTIDQAFTVDYATQDGTATAGSNDYAAASGTLNFAGTNGETQNLQVVVINDDKVELDETFTVMLSNLQVGGKNVTITTGTGTGTITNDDAATLSIDDVTKAENADGGVTTDFVFTVTLDKEVDTGLTVDYGTGDNTATTAGADYVANTNQLGFGGSVGETQTITVTVNNDDIVEADETFGIQLTNLQANGRSVTIADADGVGTITNDDVATITIEDVSGNEDDGAITLTATLSNAVDVPFNVTVESTNGTAMDADGGDYTTLNQTLTFAGTAGETQTFTVIPTTDQILEADETLTVSMTGTTLTNTSDLTDQAIVTIKNDDAASFSITDKTLAEGNSGNTAFEFEVTLTGAVDQQVTVDFTTGDGTATTANSDYSTNANTLTFSGADGQTQTITVDVSGDTVEEPDETFNVVLSNVGDGGKGVTIADNTGLGTIENEDDNTAPTGFTVTWDDVEINAAEAGSASFTFAGAEEGTTYNYTITSSGGGSVPGSGTINTPTDKISGIDVSSLSDGALTLSVTLTDGFSNTSTAQTDQADLDTTAPTGTSVETVTTDTGEANDDEITSDNTLSFSGLAEVGSSVEVFLDGTSLGTVTATDVGDWTFDHTGTTLADGTYAITAKATDTFGNEGALSSALSVTVDTGIPSVSVTTAAGSLVNGTFNVTVTYSEQMVNVAESDVSVSNGTTSNFTPLVAGQSWTVDITPISDGAVTVQIPAATANDASGNDNTASNALPLTFDGTPPVVASITRDNATPTPLTEVTYTVVFSEDVSGVDLSDFETSERDGVTGSSAVGVVQNTAANYTVTVNRGTGEGYYNLVLKDDDSIIDDAGNPLGGTGANNGGQDGPEYQTNTSPEDIQITATSIDEKNGLTDVIGTFTTTDPDPLDVTFTYALVAGEGDDDNASFAIPNGSDQLVATEIFDFETKNTYSIRVQTTDPQGGTYPEVFEITINDVNERSTDIDLSNSEIEESDDPVLVGVLTALGDPDDGETYNYTIVQGEGDANNLLFEIPTGTDQLRTSGATNFEETTSLTVRVRATDSGGLFFEKAFTITITDNVIEPLRNFTKDEADARVKNFFTPNGDGQNDLWIVEDILDNPINEVKVYSQAGKLVFSQRNYENNWDGTFDGEPIPPGTYYYEINIYNGESIIRGFLTIIRN